MPAPISEYAPQASGDARRRRRAALLAWAAAVAAAALLVGLILLAPAARARGLAFSSAAVYQAFRPVCHQIAGRSFHLEGFPLAVCARCFGLYAGALAGLLFYPLARSLKRTDAPHRAWVVAAALPTSVDFALGVLGLWENTHWSRFSTALVLGASSAFYVVPGLADLASRAGRRKAAGAPPAGARGAEGRPV